MALADTTDKLTLREPINNLDLKADFGAENVLEMRTQKGTKVANMVDSGTPVAADLPLIPKGSILQSTTGKLFINDAGGDWVEVSLFTAGGLILAPSFTTAGLPAAGLAGAVAFDTTLGKLVVDNGTAYEAVTSV